MLRCFLCYFLLIFIRCVLMRFLHLKFFYSMDCASFYVKIFSMTFYYSLQHGVFEALKYKL